MFGFKEVLKEGVVFGFCNVLSRHELYKLRIQIESSSKSVKDNIAEANETKTE